MKLNINNNKRIHNHHLNFIELQNKNPPILEDGKLSIYNCKSGFLFMENDLFMFNFVIILMSALNHYSHCFCYLIRFFFLLIVIFATPTIHTNGYTKYSCILNIKQLTFHFGLMFKC